jgi:hypothetical protein
VTDFGEYAVIGRMQQARLMMAAIAEQQANLAERFAVCLEQAAERGSSERRLALAEAERETAKVERRNAARLRDLSDVRSLNLEHLPSLPGFEPRDGN